MAENFANEKWKKIDLKIKCTCQTTLEISNYGRIRSFNKISDGRILKGGISSGYRSLSFNVYTPREQKAQEKLDYMLQQKFKLMRKITTLKRKNESKKVIKEAEQLLEVMSKSLTQKYAADLESRRVRLSFLFHRLVAKYFLPKPSKKQTIVIHLDYNKLNNKVDNLKWVTMEESIEHQQTNPNVLKARKEKVQTYVRNPNSKTLKLNVTKVMLIKKLLNEGKSAKKLGRQFKVSEMQIYRIKWGENWGDIEAAK